MADVELIKWSGDSQVVFYLKSNEIRGYKDLAISAKLDTENTTVDGQTYTTRKNHGNYEIKLTAVLNASLGVDVYGTAIRFTESARHGSSGYFYIASGGKLMKFLTMQFIATDAQIKNVRTNRAGTWVSCEVDFTLKQCSKFDGSTTSAAAASSGGGGGGGGGSAGGTGATSRKYTVQIPGMGAVTVWATSVQGAIKQAAGTNWNGTIYVDGKTYSVTKGVINTNTTTTNTTTTKTTQTSTVSSTVQKVVNTVKTTVTNVVDKLKTAAQNLLKNVSAAKTASNNVTKNANTKTTVKKPLLNNQYVK